jgi:cold-inducible RNA-binding protein
MGKRLYVGNLSFITTREKLEATFCAAGEVREVLIPTDSMTGQPRGFAYVTMASDRAAADAIEMLNGSVVDGRPIRVNEAMR